MKRLHLQQPLGALILLGALIALLVPATVFGKQAKSEKWEGVWFTCEHAQRQRAPDDNCQMFDNEGFEYRDDQLHYLEVIGSTQTGCRGNKTGHCFLRDSRSITVIKKPIGDIRIENNKLILRYWGCEQSFSLTKNTDFMTVKPDGKSCIWSRERHFYIAPYEGEVSWQK